MIWHQSSSFWTELLTFILYIIYAKNIYMQEICKRIISLEIELFHQQEYEVRMDVLPTFKSPYTMS